MTVDELIKKFNAYDKLIPDNEGANFSLLYFWCKGVYDACIALGFIIYVDEKGVHIEGENDA